MRRLREQSLAAQPGQLIGRENELLASLGVSQATLRKAAALVSQEQLIRVRRGIGGGYFARRPDATAVAHIAAIYLQSRRTGLEEILLALEPLTSEMGALAAQNRDPQILQEWRDFQDRDSKVFAGGAYRDFLKTEREFSQILGLASGNHVLNLFASILFEFCGFLGPDEDIFRDRPDRVQEYWGRRRLWVAAIIDGDADLTSFAARRCTRSITTWMVEERLGGEAAAPASLPESHAKGPTVLGRLVRQLREAALATPEGEPIGSEDQLLALYKVSRPTLRQAAALVSHEQLLTVKRGSRGGYFARRPATDAVAHISAVYLQSRHTALNEIIRAIEPIKVEMAILAARNRDAAQLDELRHFQARDLAEAETGGYRDFLRSERDFGHLIGRACRNSILELFLTTLYRFSGFLGPDEDVFRHREDRARQYWAARHKYTALIIDGDAELAGISARRCTRLSVDWMIADAERRQQSSMAPLPDMPP